MMKLFITGAKGQLGRELRKLLDYDNRFSVIYTDVQELDITDEIVVDSTISAIRPDYIINCAAYTAVDKAEDEESIAMRINAHAVEALASVAARNSIRMIHVSTDYVFDGMANRPYSEDDLPHPMSVYGRTKLEGENALQRLLPNQSVVLRTAWLYSSHGKNFVKTMLELGRTRDSLRVVNDQVGSPTLAADLARAIITVLTAPKWSPGIYHYTNEGEVSWYGFAKLIHRYAGITGCDVLPCSTHEYPTKALRPAYSVLDKSKFKSTFNVTIPSWEDSLQQFIQNYQSNYGK